MQAQSPTGIEVEAGFFPLMWILYFCSPTIEIDGYEFRKTWGKHFFQVEPGWHKVTVFFPYLFLPRAGANSIDVYVHPGYITRVKYSMNIPFVFAKGSIREVC